MQTLVQSIENSKHEFEFISADSPNLKDRTIEGKFYWQKPDVIYTNMPKIYNLELKVSIEGLEIDNDVDYRLVGALIALKHNLDSGGFGSSHIGPVVKAYLGIDSLFPENEMYPILNKQDNEGGLGDTFKMYETSKDFKLRLNSIEIGDNTEYKEAGLSIHNLKPYEEPQKLAEITSEILDSFLGFIQLDMSNPEKAFYEVMGISETHKHYKLFEVLRQEDKYEEKTHALAEYLKENGFIDESDFYIGINTLSHDNGHTPSVMASLMRSAFSNLDLKTEKPFEGKLKDLREIFYFMGIKEGGDDFIFNSAHGTPYYG